MPVHKRKERPRPRLPLVSLLARPARSGIASEYVGDVFLAAAGADVAGEDALVLVAGGGGDLGGGGVRRGRLGWRIRSAASVRRTRAGQLLIWPAGGRLFARIGGRRGIVTRACLAPFFRGTRVRPQQRSRCACPAWRANGLWCCTSRVAHGSQAPAVIQRGRSLSGGLSNGSRRPDTSVGGRGCWGCDV